MLGDLPKLPLPLPSDGDDSDSASDSTTDEETNNTRKWVVYERKGLRVRGGTAYKSKGRRRIRRDCVKVSCS